MVLEEILEILKYGESESNIDKKLSLIYFVLEKLITRQIQLENYERDYRD